MLPKKTAEVNHDLYEFLRMLEREARDSGADKLGYTYFKAGRSIKNYNLPIVSGSEARSLEGIGPVIAQKIDAFFAANPTIKQNQELLKRIGVLTTAVATSVPCAPPSVNPASTLVAPTASTAPSTTAPTTAPTPTTTASTTDENAPAKKHRKRKTTDAESSTSSPNGQIPKRPKQKKQKDTTTTTTTNTSNMVADITNAQLLSSTKKMARPVKKYIPKLRSAPWAFLIALYRATTVGIGNMENLTKMQLVDLSQPLCDTSILPQFLSNAGHNPQLYYCGWSSMGPLLDKGLIRSDRGSISRYSLSDEGKALAKELHEAAIKFDDVVSSTTLHSTPPSSQPATVSGGGGSGGSDAISSTPTTMSTQEIKPASAAIDIDSNEMTNTQPFEDDVEPQVSTTQTRVDPTPTVPAHTAQMEGYYVDENGFVSRDINDSQICIENDSCLYKVQITSSRQLLDFLISNKVLQLQEGARILTSQIAPNYVIAYGWVPEQYAPDNSENMFESMQKQFRDSNTISPSQPISLSQESRQSCSSATSSKPTTTTPPGSTTTSPECTSKMSTPLSSTTTSPVSSATSLALSTSECLFSREFDVILYVDSRERVFNDRQSIADLIKQNNIPCEVQTLELGDMLWVARRKPLNNPDVPCHFKALKDEFVLNFIAERKVAEDLAHSIIDGRYMDQKTRLHRSGIPNVYYLLEGDVRTHQNQLPSSQLQRALISTQLSTHFIVVQSKDIQETIAYLIGLTREIQHILDTDCRSVDDVIQHYAFLKGDMETQGPLLDPIANTANLAQFNRCLGKSRNLMVQDVFARQLALIRGCSSEKSATITSIFPTPISLMRKYEAAANEKERETLLQDVACQARFGTFKKIGPALSKFISRLYTLEAYPLPTVSTDDNHSDLCN